MTRDFRLQIVARDHGHKTQGHDDELASAVSSYVAGGGLVLFF